MNSRCYFKQNWKVIGLAIFFIGLLILVYGYKLSSLKGPFILNDELGYWTHASTLAGKTWYNALGENFPWYSYGYSVIIAPIIRLCSNLSSAYQTAIVINIVFAIANFFLSYRIARKIFKQESLTALGICFVCACYPSIMFQVKIAWSETFLSFMVWLTLNLFVNYLTTLKLSRGLICTFSLFGCYTVHNRTLGILCAFLLVVILMSIKNKINKYHFIVFALVFLACFLVNKGIQNFLEKTEMIYYGGQYATYNGFSTNFGKIKEIFTLTGIKNLLLSFSGKLWYLITASFLIAAFCFIDLIKVQIDMIGKQKKICTDAYIFKTFILLSILFTMGVSSIFMLEPFSIESNGAVRIDRVIYGRYTECLIGIILLSGVTCFLQLRRNTKDFLRTGVGIILFYIPLTLALSSIIDCIKTHYINIPNVVGVMFFGTEKFSILICGILVLTIFLFFIILNYIWRKEIVIYLCISLISTAFIYTGYVATSLCIFPNQNSKYPLFGDYDNNIINFDGNIYLWGTQNSLTPLLMMNKPTYRITDGNIKKIEDGSLIIVPQVYSDTFIAYEDFLPVVKGKEENVWFKSEGEKLYVFDIANIKRNLFVTSDSLLYADNEYVYWNSEKDARIVCNLPKEDLECSIDFGWAIPFERISLPELPVEIWINGHYISTILLDENMQINSIYSFKIDADVLKDGRNIMTLKPKSTWSPAEYGSTDERILSFPIKEIRFIPQ